MKIALETLKTLVVFWHVMAFAFGGVYVVHSYRAALGYEPAQKFWSRILRQADIHLWLSGFAVIGVGIALKGFLDYMDNPKLWTKVIVITLWLATTQYMRHIGFVKLRSGRGRALYIACGIEMACWTYGALLGCAKGLAYGVIPFWVFLSGFILILAASIGMTFRLRRT